MGSPLSARYGRAESSQPFSIRRTPATTDTILGVTSPGCLSEEAVHQLQLPDTLAEMGEAAVADAFALDTELYRPKSGQWHNPAPEGCLVCLAGCIIARTLHAPAGRIRFPRHYSVKAENKLIALDAMRGGHLRRAYHVFCECEPERVVGERLSLPPRPRGVQRLGRVRASPCFAPGDHSKLHEIEATAINR